MRSRALVSFKKGILFIQRLETFRSPSSPFRKNSSYCLKWTAAARHIIRPACARCKNKGQGSSAPFRKEQFTFMVAALPQWSQWPQWSPFVVSLLSVAIYICTITYCHLKVNYLSTTSLLFFVCASIIFYSAWIPHFFQDS